jgi:hypothetical protein
MNSLVEAHSNSIAVSGNDGWGDVAAESGERVLRGDLLKFSDGTWLVGRESIPVEKDRKLVAVGCASAWVRWAGGKPDKYIVRQPGAASPEREDLGDSDETKWEPGPDNRPRDPWMSTRYVYLVDPHDASAYTFSTSSWGGRGAVIDLADAIQRYRAARPGASPVVLLEAAAMKTKYGVKRRPVLKIIDWVGGDIPESSGTTPRLVSSTQRIMDDEIPFASEWR